MPKNKTDVIVPSLLLCEIPTPSQFRELPPQMHETGLHSSNLFFNTGIDSVPCSRRDLPIECSTRPLGIIGLDRLGFLDDLAVGPSRSTLRLRTGTMLRFA